MNIAPYALTETEWRRRYNKARENLAGNYVQCRVNRSSGSQMVAAAAEIDFLLFNVRHDLLNRLRDDSPLSEFGRLKLIALLERPVTYARVRIRAKRLGLI